MANRKKEIALCRPCMERVKAVYTLAPLETGKNMKVSCEICGKRRYGAIYKREGKK